MAFSFCLVEEERPQGQIQRFSLQSEKGKANTEENTGRYNIQGV